MRFSELISVPVLLAVACALFLVGCDEIKYVRTSASAVNQTFEWTIPGATYCSNTETKNDYGQDISCPNDPDQPGLGTCWHEVSYCTQTTTDDPTYVHLEVHFDPAAKLEAGQQESYIASVDGWSRQIAIKVESPYYEYAPIPKISAAGGVIEIKMVGPKTAKK